MYIDYRYVEGYTDYIITNYGVVISLKKKKPIIIKPGLDGGGYAQVNLFKNGKGKTIKVHVIVGNTFVGKRTGSLTFDHIDRVRTNNRVDNIRLATRTQQCINRNMRCDNTTGETNITIVRNGKYTYYHIEIQRNGKKIVDKMFNVKKYSINDAVIFRDEQLTLLNQKSIKA